MNGNFDAIRQEIDGATNIAIMVGDKPNIDQMGAALSLYLSLQAASKMVSVISPKDPLVEVSNLVGIDKVKKTFEGSKSGDLTVSFPYREGEIEKISYTLENGFLNIIVKASSVGLTFEEKDVLFKRAGSGIPSVVFTVGISRLSDLTSIFNLDALKDTRIINIDNSLENQGFGDISLVDSNASSISELVASLILELGLKLDTDSSQNILSGISFATQNFSNPKTTALAFEMGAIMMRNGARRGRGREKQSPNMTQSQNPFGTMSALQFNQNQGQAAVQQMQNPQNRGNIQRENQKENNDTTPPGDWLEPKIFKGSTNVS